MLDIRREGRKKKYHDAKFSVCGPPHGGLGQNVESVESPSRDYYEKEIKSSSFDSYSRRGRASKYCFTAQRLE